MSLALSRIALSLIAAAALASCALDAKDSGPDAGAAGAAGGDGGAGLGGASGDTDASDADRGGGPAKKARIDPGKTNDAERVSKLPVGTSASGAKRRIVMRLSSNEIPRLAAGDRLIAPAEVQVTTRCDVGQAAPGCDYNPHIRAQLILTGAKGDKRAAGSESRALSDVTTQTCTKGEHHCLFVFRPANASQVLEGGFNLPCVADSSCYINLVMWAWHPDARSGGVDAVLVGENEGNYLDNGVVSGDKGRLMVVRERGLVAADRHVREISGGGSLSVPTNASPTLIYSLPLKAGGKRLEKGEQFVVEAKMVTAVSSRARFSTKMFLTRNPAATDGGGLDKTFPRSIGEHNGINCTSKTSPCTVRKVAVFRVEDDINGPVYVNVVAKSAVPGGGAAAVTVKRDQGWLRSTRYQAAY